MPEHAPTRRSRQHRRWAPAPAPPPGDGPEDWRPAARDSRLPAWVPAPIRWLLHWGFRLAVVGACVFVAVALFYFALSYGYDLDRIKEMPERSVISDVQGGELGTLHGASRRIITREEIPPFFVRALRAREDKRFYDHGGVDVAGLARATLRNVKDGSFTQGASTITMQLARNSLDLRAKSLHRKLLEIAISVRIEWRFSKDEILTAYLNRIYFGSGCHGLDQAARHYFGAGAAELTPNQCALLAGIIRAPHACSPFRNLDKALEQRDQVLDRMVAEEMITAEEATHIRDTPLGLRDRKTAHLGSASLQAIRRHLEEILAESEVRQGGLHLRSTIHSDIQQLLERELETIRAAAGEGFEAAGICLNNRTGGVRAIVGGAATDNSPYNRALDARRDLGSIFTPFLYAAAAEHGETPLRDQPVATGRTVGTDYLIRITERFGFEGPFPETDDLYRGAFAATPLELATAAATLARRGTRPRTIFIREVRDHAGRRLFQNSFSATPILAPASAAAALAVQFPDGEPRILTGLSPARTDLWAVSFGSRNAICLWVGSDQPKPLPDAPGTQAAVEASLRRIVLSISS